MTLNELQAKFPGYTIRQDPDPHCASCEGRGWVGPTKRGTTAPCLCAVLSEPHGEQKQELIRMAATASARIVRYLRDGARYYAALDRIHRQALGHWQESEADGFLKIAVIAEQAMGDKGDP